MAEDERVTAYDSSIPLMLRHHPSVPPQIRTIRKKMVEIMTREAGSCDLKDLVAKFIPEAIGKEIEKACQGAWTHGMRGGVRRLPVLTTGMRRGGLYMRDVLKEYSGGSLGSLRTS